jgi:hypothetical protein
MFECTCTVHTYERVGRFRKGKKRCVESVRNKLGFARDKDV